MRAFRLHFNKNNARVGNPYVWTVHALGKCFQVRAVHSFVPMRTTYNPARQPKACLVGEAYVRIIDEVAYLCASENCKHSKLPQFFEWRE